MRCVSFSVKKKNEYNWRHANYTRFFSSRKNLRNRISLRKTYSKAFLYEKLKQSKVMKEKLTQSKVMKEKLTDWNGKNVKTAKNRDKRTILPCPLL